MDFGFSNFATGVVGSAARPREKSLCRDGVYKAVNEIWVRVLGRKAAPGKDLLHLDIGVRRVLRMLSLIEQATGVWISPTAALLLGRPEAIAEAIVEGRIPPASPLILLKPGMAMPSLYIVSGGGGFILDQMHLVEAIAYPGPIYGLQLPGLDGGTPLNRVENIAAYYLRHIYAFQPSGPYYVLGYSFGGLVAAEMGRAMAQAGKDVGMVGLLDGYLQQSCWPVSAWASFMIVRLTSKIAKLRDLPIRERIFVMRKNAANLSRRCIRRIVPGDRLEVQQSPHYIGGLPPHVQTVRDGAIAAYEAYRPAPFACKITLFKSAKGDAHFCDPEKMWRALARDLDVVTVPGTHTTMVRPPFAAFLAAEISRRLGVSQELA